MVLSMDRWKGKVAVITGASSGIGSAIAQQLVAAGLQVAGLARRVERVEALAASLSGLPGRLHAVPADVTDEASLLAAFAWVAANLGPVHVLVNNAGIIKDTSLTGGDLASWRATFDTNVLGLCVATREAIASMRRAGVDDGHIVHVNSVSGHLIPTLPNFNVYTASKWAVTALRETLRQELERAGSRIKVSDVSPGMTKTEIGDNHSAVKKEILEGKSLKAEDIADAVVYVLSTPPYVQVRELIVTP